MDTIQDSRFIRGKTEGWRLAIRKKQTVFDTGYNSHICHAKSLILEIVDISVVL